MKEQVKGITLITLVVTIIVLLILAGVALNLTIGQNGIFTRAQDAANTWKNAEANEQLALQGLSDMIDEILEGPKPEEGTLAAMYVQAVEDGCTNEDGTCDNPNHLHIGDYVDFKSLTEDMDEKQIEVLPSDTGWNETQTYTVNFTTNQLNWQVLGYDAKKMQVKLIAATPLKSDGSDGYLWMKGAQSYVTGYLVPDKISKEIYGEMPYVAEARSVKIEDINELLGIKTTDDIRKYNLYGYYDKVNYGDSYNIEEVYIPEEYLNSLGSGLSGTVDGYYYSVNEAVGEGAPYVTLSNERIDNLIFNDPEYGLVKVYWLSSCGVFATSDYASFAICLVAPGDGIRYVSLAEMFYSESDGFVDELDNGAGVRPVVSLESGVKASDVPKIADQVNPSWGGSGEE